MQVKADLIWTLGPDQPDSETAFGESWLPGVRLLAIAGFGHGLEVWDTDTGRRRLTISHPALISCVGCSPDGHRLVGGSSAGEVLVFDVDTGGQLLRACEHRDEVRAVAYSPDGQRIASGANDGSVLVWDAATLKLLASIPAHASLVRSVAWSPDGERIASGGHDCSVRVWDANT